MGYGEQFIDQGTKRWDVQKVCDIFFSHEVEVILKIPLSSHMPNDILVWAENKSGEFLVKSAYKVVLRFQKKRGIGENSNRGARRKFWMLLWNMKISNKMKTFAWRACKDILPTKVNLDKKNVIAETICDFCMVEIEDGMHTQFSCLHVQWVWRVCFIGIDFTHTIQHNFSVFAWDLVEKFPTIDLELVFTKAWGLWNRRNYFIHNGEILDSWLVVDEARTSIEAYKCSRKCTRIHKRCSKKEKIVCWKPPPAGVFKLNVDGALFMKHHKVGVCAILRDEKGNMIMAMRKLENGVDGVDDIEALAALRTLQVVCHIGVSHIIPEEIPYGWWML